MKVIDSAVAKKVKNAMNPPFGNENKRRRAYSLPDRKLNKLQN